LGGLLLLIDFIVRKQTPKGLSISSELADDFVSALGRPKSCRTIREPLALLCRLGILRRIQAAVNGRHVKTSARYALDGTYARQHMILEVDLTPYLVKKRERATERREAGLDRRYPFRAQLKADQEKLSFDPGGRRRITELLGDPKFGPAARRAIEAVDRSKHPLPKISPRGQITTSISGCPREMKLLLRLDNEPIAFCDISHAHHCFLTTLLADRIDHLRRTYGSAAETGHYKAELQQLVTFLSDGDLIAGDTADMDAEISRTEEFMCAECTRSGASILAIRLSVTRKSGS
jgi:hypothetical protein